MQAERIPPKRKYALSKVAAGDYVFPSNDGKTVWRIAKYEDGPSHGITDWDRDREFWGVWRWAEPFTGNLRGYVDLEDWNRWEFCEGMHDTRGEAVDAALRMAS